MATLPTAPNYMREVHGGYYSLPLVYIRQTYVSAAGAVCGRLLWSVNVEGIYVGVWFEV